MSYSVLITRNNSHPFWFDPESPSPNRIKTSEWNRAVAADDNLIHSTETNEADDWFDASIPARHDSPVKYLATLVSCRTPTLKFSYNETTGTIILKNPTPIGIEKSLEIAQSLDAMVRGYDGEIYVSGTEFDWHPDEIICPGTRTHWISVMLDGIGLSSFMMMVIFGGVLRGLTGMAIGAILGFVLMFTLLFISISLNKTANVSE